MKEIARLRNLARRNCLTKDQVEEKSRLVAKRLEALPEFANAKTILAYFGVNNEVETKEIIEKALKEGKKVALPVTDFEKKTIIPTEISSLDEVTKTRQGLIEPKGKKPVEKNAFDLIIVPGIAFDKNCCRIGRGKGFYDELLRKTSTKIPLIGLCFDENLEEQLPNESHDVKMDIVVTDKQIVRCS